jgi:hypothetical protein
MIQRDSRGFTWDGSSIQDRSRRIVIVVERSTVGSGSKVTGIRRQILRPINVLIEPRIRTDFLKVPLQGIRRPAADTTHFRHLSRKSNRERVGNERDRLRGGRVWDGILGVWAMAFYLCSIVKWGEGD